MKKYRLTISDSVMTIFFIILFFLFTGTAGASTAVNINYVYPRYDVVTNGPAQPVITFNPVDALVSSSPLVIRPYSTVKIVFDHGLSATEQLAIQGGLRIFNLTDSTNVSHLNEISTVPVAGEQASFDWKDSFQTLYYTPEGLEPGKAYRIDLPTGWTASGAGTSFSIQPVTGTTRTYNIIIPDLQAWQGITTPGSASTGEFVPCVFKDKFNNKQYLDTEIRIRGYSSAWAPKKGYTIQFNDDNLFTGFKDSSDVFQGMRKKIVLIANMIFNNTTFINNRLSYDVIRQVESRSHFYGTALAPDSYFVLVTINGRFWGLYDLTEHIDTGLGGWSTMKDRVEKLGFDLNGGGMLHKVDWDGQTNYPLFGNTFGIIPQSEFKYRLSLEGDGYRTHWDGTIPYPVFVETMHAYMPGGKFTLADFDFSIKAKWAKDQPKMELAPDKRSGQYDDINFSWFNLKGDGAGKINLGLASADFTADFSKPVQKDKPVNAYFKTSFDFDESYRAIENNQSKLFEWLNVDGVLLNIFFVRFANSWDNITHNIYLFAPAMADSGEIAGPLPSLEAYRGAALPPAKYYQVIWDCDLAFQPPGTGGGMWGEEPFPWEKAEESLDARQRYVNLLYRELLPGGVLTPAYYQQKFQAYKDEIGNGFELENLRWDRNINIQPVLDNILNNLANANTVKYQLLSLADQYLPPTVSFYKMQNPVPETRLENSSVLFAWTAAPEDQEFKLAIGTFDGAADIYEGNLGLNTSVRVDGSNTKAPFQGIPLSGRPVFVKLSWRIGADWQQESYYYETINDRAAVLVRPAQGTFLRASELFEWSEVPGTQYRLTVSTSPNPWGPNGGQGIIYDGQTGRDFSGTSVTVPGLPQDGTFVYVFLTTEFSLWDQYTNLYTLKTKRAGDPDPIQPAEIINPSPGATLGQTNNIFMWTAGTGASQYVLSIGSAPGSSDIYSGQPTTGTSAQVWNIPLTGQPIYVRLWSLSNESQVYKDYTYQTRGNLPPVITPIGDKTVLEGQNLQFTVIATDPDKDPLKFSAVLDNGQVLSTIGAKFTDSGNGTGAFAWPTPVGPGVNSVKIIFKASDPSGASDSKSSSIMVYHKATMTAPQPGSILSISTILFSWNPGNGVTEYSLAVGTQPGMADIYNANVGTSTSVKVANIPQKGSPVYVRLGSRIAGLRWFYQDYTYQTTRGGYVPPKR